MEQGLSLRKFAKELSEGISYYKVSHQSISNWENGIHAPSFQMLIGMVIYSSGWRHDFALDCLSSIAPDLYEPAGAIGRKILKRDME